MHDIRMRLAFCFALFATVACAENFVTDVTVRQIQPWNGLVEITVGLPPNYPAELVCMFAATNGATRAALPVSHIRQVGSDTSSGSELKRHFIWDAAADLGEVKIDDVALTVDASIVDVQLWENGPYWASCNIGAAKPEECGYYFWWGDTVGYKRNASDEVWISVKDFTPFSFSSGNCPTYDKGTSNLQSAGYIDTTGNLAAEHDAATAHLGAPWRMPTDSEFLALTNNCTITWTTRNGVAGLLVIGKGAYASKSIFLPAAGCGDESSRQREGSFGCYWSSSCYKFSTSNPLKSMCAWSPGFDSGHFYRHHYYRYYGLSVRPVRGFAK